MVFYDVPTGFDADHTMKKRDVVVLNKSQRCLITTTTAAKNGRVNRGFQTLISSATTAKDEEQMWLLGFRVKRMKAQNPNSTWSWLWLLADMISGDSWFWILDRTVSKQQLFLFYYARLESSEDVITKTVDYCLFDVVVGFHRFIFLIVRNGGQFEYWKAELEVVDSNSYLKSRGSIEDFVSFREMITSQLQGKLWLYDEVRTRLCLFCHHQIGEDCWDS
ncbi:hypothetical protein Tco_0556116 [Tanacetum coccineum]